MPIDDYVGDKPEGDDKIVQGAMPHPVSPSPVARTSSLESRTQTRSGLSIVMKDT